MSGKYQGAGGTHKVSAGALEHGVAQVAAAGVALCAPNTHLNDLPSMLYIYPVLLEHHKIHDNQQSVVHI